MNILLISPLSKPIRPESKYLGIERLVYEYSRELVKEHKVTIMGHADSVYAEGVFLLPTRPPTSDVFAGDELLQFQSYQLILRDYDVIHDLSHQHLASRFVVNLPTLSIFWHAPALVKYPKAPHNIISISQWGAREFGRIYRQEARYQQSIAIDTDRYKLAHRRRNDRFLTIGRMAPEKGNLNAIMLCKKVGVPLDVVGGRGMEKSANEPLSEYEQQIQAHCDGKQIKFLGEVDEEQKIKLMQACKALLYATDHPEVFSHKIQEAMLCGARIIAPRLGGIPEIIDNGVSGFLCRTEDEYLTAIKDVDKLAPLSGIEALKHKYSVENVCKDYVGLYQQVKEGLRW